MLARLGCLFVFWHGWFAIRRRISLLWFRKLDSHGLHAMGGWHHRGIDSLVYAKLQSAGVARYFHAGTGAFLQPLFWQSTRQDDRLRKLGAVRFSTASGPPPEPSILETTAR